MTRDEITQRFTRRQEAFQRFDAQALAADVHRGRDCS